MSQGERQRALAKERGRTGLGDPKEPRQIKVLTPGTR